MSRLLLLVVVVYIIGICVQLAPVVRASWDTVPASQLTADVLAHLPEASSWPVRVFDNLRNKTNGQP
ncbi:hypothetical protein [Labrys wisconsinensis]|uniref:Uncharacterized protein n=1 Tax=Labrys wisconsinensis TaxID=425677 RepID=A0ABU0JBJ4_9HYPH|nr:hypothetical protein [Labrys wisconsinensis]MDQ0470522.1 hypothetical protein [Labrys wisconsinensis]